MEHCAPYVLAEVADAHWGWMQNADEWQLPQPDFHRQVTTSSRTRRFTRHHLTVPPPTLLAARIIRAMVVNIVSPALGRS